MALRVDVGAAGAGAGALVRLVVVRALAGAVELENTDCVPWRLTPAVAPLWRAVTGDCALVVEAAGTRGAEVVALELLDEPVRLRGNAVAPLVDAEAVAPEDVPVAVPPAEVVGGPCAVAAAGVPGALVGGGDATAAPVTFDPGVLLGVDPGVLPGVLPGVDLGVAGVPKPDGVQAQA